MSGLLVYWCSVVNMTARLYSAGLICAFGNIVTYIFTRKKKLFNLEKNKFYDLYEILFFNIYIASSLFTGWGFFNLVHDPKLYETDLSVANNAILYLLQCALFT